MALELRGFCLAAVVAAGLPWTGVVAAQETPSQPEPTPSSTAETTEPEPKPPPRRADFLATPGAPRKALPGLFDTKEEPAEFPRGKEKLFDEARQGQPLTPEHRKVIDDAAKAHAYALTSKSGGNEAVGVILRTVATAKDASGRVSTDFVKLYKSAVIKHLKHLLSNSIYVQINALFAMSELQNRVAGDALDEEREIPDVTDAVPIFVEVVIDDNRADAVVLMALQGLMRAKRSGLIQPGEEQKVAYRVLDLLGNSSKADDVQPVLKEKMIETLGVLQRPYAQNPEDVQVATLLATLALDPNSSKSERLEAGRALSRLNVRSVPQWNAKLQACIVAGVIKDNQARLEVADAQAQYDAYLWLEAIPAPSAVAYPELAQVLREKVLGPIVNPRMNDGKGPDFSALDQWIADNPMPEDRKLGPRGAEIVFPEPASNEDAEAGSQ